MHAGLEERVAVQRAPEADRAEGFLRLQPVVAEVAHQLIGGEIDVIEGDDAGGGRFHDLRAPSRLPAGVEALATVEAQLFQECHVPRKILPRAAIGVMVVIAPAQPQLVLPGLLHLRRPVSPLPVTSLGLEKQSALDV